MKCEWWIPATKRECITPAAYIVDCDNCKNAVACIFHIGDMINRHFETDCSLTLHVDEFPSKSRHCGVCGGDGEHNWEIHKMEATSTYGRD